MPTALGKVKEALQAAIRLATKVAFEDELAGYLHFAAGLNSMSTNKVGLKELAAGQICIGRAVLGTRPDALARAFFVLKGFMATSATVAYEGTEVAVEFVAAAVWFQSFSVALSCDIPEADDANRMRMLADLIHMQIEYEQDWEKTKFEAMPLCVALHHGIIEAGIAELDGGMRSRRALVTAAALSVRVFVDWMVVGERVCPVGLHFAISFCKSPHPPQ